MASEEGLGNNETKLTYEAEFMSQAEAPEVHTALHRKLKNRHVAMIRYISLRACRSTTPADPCFQYWWCHRYRSLPGISNIPHEWWSPRYSLGLLVRWNDMFCYHGLFLSPPIPGTHRLISHHSFLSVK